MYCIIKSLLFRYSIQPGICTQSFGLEVARLAGFPEETLAAAKRYLEEYERELGNFKGGKYVEEMKDILERSKQENVDKKKLLEEARELAKRARLI